MILFFLQIYFNRAMQPAHYEKTETRAPPMNTVGVINSTALVWTVYGLHAIEKGPTKRVY